MDNGEIVIVPIGDASFSLTVSGLVIYNDPAGGRALFAGQPTPGLVLMCHEHIDHFDILRHMWGWDNEGSPGHPTPFDQAAPINSPLFAQSCLALSASSAYDLTPSANGLGVSLIGVIAQSSR